MRRLVTLLWGCVRRSVREDLAAGGRQEDGEAKDARLGAHSQPDLQRTVHSLQPAGGHGLRKASVCKWELTKSPGCSRGDPQTMDRIVDYCPLTEAV